MLHKRAYKKFLTGPIFIFNHQIFHLIMITIIVEKKILITIIIIIINNHLVIMKTNVNLSFSAIKFFQFEIYKHSKVFC